MSADDYVENFLPFIEEFYDLSEYLSKSLFRGTINLGWIPTSCVRTRHWFFINNTWEYCVGYLILGIYNWNLGHQRWRSISIY